MSFLNTQFILLVFCSFELEILREKLKELIFKKSSGKICPLKKITIDEEEEKEEEGH